MLPLLVPVFAQLVTLGVADRSEARYVVAHDRRYEASTNPGGRLALRWRRYDLTLGYGSSLTLTPLQTKPRDLLVYHSASLATAYRFRRTRLSLNNDSSFGDVNFRLAVLRTATDPAAAGDGGDDEPPEPGGPDEPAPDSAPDPEPGSGTGQPGSEPGAVAGEAQTRIVDRVVRYGTSTTRLELAHDATRELTLVAFTGYSLAGGLNDADRQDYPLLHGYTVAGEATHTLGLKSRDGFVSLLSGAQTWSSNGNAVTSLIARETWSHRLDRHAESSLGAGLSISRFSQDDGLVGYSVFPEFNAGLTYRTLLGRGDFSFQTNFYSTPALDPLRATVDPRVGISGSMGWSRDRFSTYVGGNVSLSRAAPDANAGAFNTYQGYFSMAYRLADWVAVDAGGRAVKQEFQDLALVPFSYAAFLGLELGYEIPLHGRTR